MKMTTLRTSWTTLWTVGCLAMALAACSDGNLSNAPANPVESTSVPVLINSFTVADASDANAKADKSVNIESGGSVMVSWDVSNAKSLEITDSKGKRVPNVEGLIGKTQSDPFAADETLTLTAEGSDGVKAQAITTITILKKEIKITSFRADPEKINAGEETKLCWTITDSKAKVSVKAGDVEIYPGNAVPETTPDELSDVSVTTVSKAMRFLLKGNDTPVVDAVEVCPLTDKPTKTTTYTLSVMDGDKVAATQDAIVTVASAPADIAAFVAQPAQLSGPGETTLTWRVSPSDVTVSIDHGVTTADKSEGEKKVQVNETTTFTLTATTKDGQTKTQTVTVTLPSAADRRVEAKALTPSIFADETAKITITHGNTSGKVSVVDAFGRTPAFATSVGVVTISGATVGSNSYTIDIDGDRSNPVMVEVRALNQHDRGAWNGVAMRGLGVVVSGSSSKTATVGLASLLDFTRFTPVSYDFGKNFAEKMKSPDHASYMSNFAPYTVHSMAISSKGRAIAGMTGGLIYSDDAGASWNVLDVIPMYDTSYTHKNVAESHVGCFGVKRTGTKSYSATIWMVNVTEVCDLAYDEAADGKDRLLIATDFGVFYIDGVDGRIKDPTNKANAMQGTLKKDNAIFGKSVNSIALAKSGDSTVVVAGAADGVYINTKRGDYKSWQQMDNAGLKDAGAVNAVAISGSTIYAGTNNGLFSYNGLDAHGKWEVVSGSIMVGCAAPDAGGNIKCAPQWVVTALAVDAADPATLYVGTSEGLKLSRDCAGSFARVTSDVGEVRNIATSADSGRSAVVVASKNGLFTSVGVAGSAGTCAAASQRPVGPK